MKRLIYSSFAIFALIFVACFSQPKLEVVGGDTYDWGTVSSKNDPLEAKIQFKNVGNQKLIISDVKPSCGCTSSKLDKNELEPNEIATIEIQLRTGGATTKNLTKTVKVTSNDPTNGTKFIYLKANVVAEMELSTPYFTFPDMTVGVQAISKLKLKNNSKQDVKISNFAVNPDYVMLNLKDEITLKPNQDIEISTKATPKVSGSFNFSVTFKTTHPDFQDMRIDGYGRVKDMPVTVPPNQKEQNLKLNK